MSKKDYTPDIRDLERSLPYYSRHEEKLSPNDLKILSKAYSIYDGYCESLLNHSVDPRIQDVYSFHKLVKPSEITELISALFDLNTEEEEEEEKEEKEEVKEDKEQEVSIPPELESLVAEYEKNQALLEEEEIKSNEQKTVAEQVKIAIKHHDIRERALANRERRQEKGEEIASLEQTLISRGSPKSSSSVEALAPSYQAIQELASTYKNFNQLSPAVQDRIIADAVELNTINVSNLDVAIQTAALLADTSNLSPEDQQYVKSVSSDYVHSVYDAVNAQTQQGTNYEKQITENEVTLLELQNEAQNLTGQALQDKLTQIKSLTSTNQNLANKINNLPHQLDVFVNNQTADFQNFAEDTKKRLEKNLDLSDHIDLANKNVAAIHDNLVNHGVKPHLYSPLDDAHLLEEAVRKDMPGELRAHSGYEAEYAAALINNPKTQSDELSPQSILLYGKEFDSKFLSKARLFAQKNPDSALGKLLGERGDIFDSLGTQLRKIGGSPLGKGVLKVGNKFSQSLNTFNKFIGKFTDKIPGGLGNLIQIAQDPLGAFRSWAGRKVGEYVVKKLLSSAIGKAAQQAATKLASKLLTEGIKKAITSIATKLGAEAALAATGVGAPVALIMFVLDIAGEVLKAIKNTVQKIATSIYGEEIKAQDILAAPAMAVGGALSAIASLFAAIGSATAAAAGSAITTIGIGTAFGFLFYISSIAVAPLISTLVQLETTPHSTVSGSCSKDLLPIVDRAIEINNNLQTGFNHSYNKSPDYPELWNATLFSQDPNPESQYDTIGAEDMFWCNYQVYKPYNENGKELRFGFTNMISDFQTNGIFYKADDITIANICPGMAVFFKIPADSSTLAHVALVTSVSEDGFTTVESNATYKTMFYPVDTSGNFQIVNTGSYTIKVESFGSL